MSFDIFGSLVAACVCVSPALNLVAPPWEECKQLSSPHAVPKVVAKFATKFLFAKLLGARLFQGSDGVKEVEQEIRESRIFSSDPARAESIMRLSNADLQQFVRNSWLKTPKEWIGENEANFMACVVKPALSVTVTNMPDCFADVISRFAVWMHNKETSETDKANMRVAAGVLQGRLQHHPLLHGIALQSLRMADKRNRVDRGILNTRGRRFMESPLEKKLITDAGLTLATSSGISSLVKMFLRCAHCFVHFVRPFPSFAFS